MSRWITTPRRVAVSAALVVLAGVVPRPASAGPVDCLVSGRDDRCEMWTAVYSDEELNYGPTDYPGPTAPSAADAVQAAALSPAGDRLFTLGISSNGEEQRWAIVATDASSGDELWVTRRAAQDLRLRDIAVSPDGSRVYVTGVATVAERAGDGQPLQNTDAFTAAYTAGTGQFLWERRYGGAPVGHSEGQEYNLHSNDDATGIAVSPVGDRVYVAGFTDTTNGFDDALLLSYRGASGDSAWTSRHDTSTPQSPLRRDRAVPALIDVTPDGKRVVVAAMSVCDQVLSPTPCSFRLMSYQGHDPQAAGSDGSLVWSRDIDFQPNSLEVSHDGTRLFLAGKASSSVVVAFDVATGAELWRAGHTTTGGWQHLAATQEAVFVTKPGIGANGFLTASYDAVRGAQRWVATLPSPEPDNASVDAIAASRDGSRVYLTGQDDAIQRTVAFDGATGQLAWSALHLPVGMTTCRGHFLEVAPDGTVFVVGSQARQFAAYYSMDKDSSDWQMAAYAP